MMVPFFNKSNGIEQNIPLLRVGLYSVLVNVFLLALNIVMAILSGSLALAAEIVHNLADLTSAIAVLIGLKVSERKDRNFPYGLYKVENVVAIIVAFFIFFTAYEISREALAPGPREVIIHPWMLLGVIVAAVVPYLFSRFELQYGKEVNSPSLIADAKEFQAHVLSSGVIFAALLGQWLGLPLDWPAALLIVVWIAWVGWQTLADSMRVLLDVSVDSHTLEQARRIVLREPSVVQVNSLIGRNAGRFRFLEAEVGLRGQDFEKSHRIGHRIESSIRKELPHVERVLVHVEPAHKSLRRLVSPLADQAGTMSPTFCTAPFFAFTDFDKKEGQIKGKFIVPNPFVDACEGHGRGLKVSQWLLEEGMDVLISAEDITKKGSGYTLHAAGVLLHVTQDQTSDSAVQAYLTAEETSPASQEFSMT